MNELDPLSGYNYGYIYFSFAFLSFTIFMKQVNYMMTKHFNRKNNQYLLIMEFVWFI